MHTYRSVSDVFQSQPVIEGAGVHLHRAFGKPEAELLDPFLLLDDFRSSRPEHYEKGFPWHPHRGIETITYLLEGSVEHGDSLGNGGLISHGDVQWMTAGSGIIHQEMPHGDLQGNLAGFQLWLNLPARRKMIPPAYRGLTADQIPVVICADSVQVRIIAGTIEGQTGHISREWILPEVFDVTMPENAGWFHSCSKDRMAALYVFQGSVAVTSRSSEAGSEAHAFYGDRSLILLGEGNHVSILSGESGGRFLYLSGLPLNEPIAWGGPIVMNTREELVEAFDEIEKGTFMRQR